MIYASRDAGFCVPENPDAHGIFSTISLSHFWQITVPSSSFEPCLARLFAAILTSYVVYFTNVFH